MPLDLVIVASFVLLSVLFTNFALCWPVTVLRWFPAVQALEVLSLPREQGFMFHHQLPTGVHARGLFRPLQIANLWLAIALFRRDPVIEPLRRG